MSSKYDLVKVKVHVEGEHYYVLSRFQLSKMLTFCQVTTTLAVKISLELKKHLVDTGATDITQKQMEEALFHIMGMFGYGAPRYTELFPAMGRFYAERIPLVILIGGSGCAGMSSVARGLSSKLNSHNVVNADVIFDMARMIERTRGGAARENMATATAAEACHAASFADSLPLPAGTRSPEGSSVYDGRSQQAMAENVPFWLKQTPLEELVDLWRTEARMVMSHLLSDIKKTFKEGKVLIIEGSLVDLSLYKEFLTQEFQKEYGAIVAAFYLSISKSRRKLAVESYVCEQRHLLPNMKTQDAVLWLLQRFDIVEATHLEHVRASFPDLREDGEMSPGSVQFVTSTTSNPSDTCNVLHEVILNRIISELKSRQAIRTPSTPKNR